MAKKDFDKYYDMIYSQYRQLQLVLKDLSEEVTTGMVEPERLENLKLTIVPVEDNYRTLSYIKYLLDMPAQKKKRARFAKQNCKLKAASSGRQQKDLVDQNAAIIDNLKL